MEAEGVVAAIESAHAADAQRFGADCAPLRFNELALKTVNELALKSVDQLPMKSVGGLWPRQPSCTVCNAPQPPQPLRTWL